MLVFGDVDHDIFPVLLGKPPGKLIHTEFQLFNNFPVFWDFWDYHWLMADNSYPIGSMYGTFTYIWLLFYGINVNIPVLWFRHGYVIHDDVWSQKFGTHKVFVVMFTVEKKHVLV